MATTRLAFVREEIKYSKITDHFLLSTPAEKSEMIMEDLFTKYPALKPSTEKEEHEVKKSFMEFLDMPRSKQKEILSGSPSQHKELSHVMKEFVKLTVVEFDQLEEGARKYFGEVNNYVIHKLCIQEVLKVYKKKEEGYEKLEENGMTDEQKFGVSMLLGATYANKWGIDPEEITKKWMTMLNPMHHEVMKESQTQTYCLMFQCVPLILPNNNKYLSTICDTFGIGRIMFTEKFTNN